ncbi:glycosyltransferase family 2 protein [Flavobacterium sp. Arc2]|uniref:glycosyltransferase family 2 protein n=1 Tax=Flavobacterium sp. Arc2 TaxID=3046685 RepID=UPI00352EF82B
MIPLVSIIIPTCNRAHLIGETLDSILSQIYTNWECIIVDDGSMDDTENIVKEYINQDNRFQFHQRPADSIKGANTCRNYGFELSKGEYIKWFDSDDILLPQALERSGVFFSEKPDLIVSSLTYIDIYKNRINKKHHFISKNTVEDYLTGRITYYTFTPTWKRSFLEKQADLFDVHITNLDDWDFNLRMLYQEPSVVYVDEPLIQYRIHGDSLSHEINKLNFNEIQSEFRAREKHLKLLKESKLANPRILQNYIIDRYKFILREALLRKDDKKIYYLRMLSISQLEVFNFRGFIKTIFGYTIFSIFNKGYKLLK